MKINIYSFIYIYNTPISNLEKAQVSDVFVFGTLLWFATAVSFDMDMKTTQPIRNGKKFMAHICYQLSSEVLE